MWPKDMMWIKGKRLILDRLSCMWAVVLQIMCENIDGRGQEDGKWTCRLCVTEPKSKILNNKYKLIITSEEQVVYYIYITHYSASQNMY